MAKILFVGGPAAGRWIEDTGADRFIVPFQAPLMLEPAIATIIQRCEYSRLVLGMDKHGHRFEFMRWVGAEWHEACAELLRGYRP